MSTHRAPQPDSDDPSPTPGSGARTAGLQRAAHERTQRAEKAADAAIRDLMKRGASINFTSVARVAGLSRAFLHRHPELSTRIHDLSRAQNDATREQHAAGAAEEAAIIAALRRKLHDEQERHQNTEKELRARVRELEQQVAALYGRLG